MRQADYAKFLRVDKTKPEALKFKDDGLIPNSKHPVLIYRSAIGFVESVPRLAARNLIADHIGKNGWRLEEGLTLYSYHLYDRKAHKAFIVINGQATLQLGGPKVGRSAVIEEGDLIVIPAGVAHRHLRYANLSLTAQFEAMEIRPVAADEPGPVRGLKKSMEVARPKALESLANIPRPFNPLYGPQGPGLQGWK
jgi:uncharacterized protein YjlB